MVGICQDERRASLAELIGNQAFHGGLGPNRHEHGGIYRSMPRFKPTTASPPVALEEHESKAIGGYGQVG